VGGENAGYEIAGRDLSAFGALFEPAVRICSCRTLGDQRLPTNADLAPAVVAAVGTVPWPMCRFSRVRAPWTPEYDAEDPRANGPADAVPAGAIAPAILDCMRQVGDMNVVVDLTGDECAPSIPCTLYVGVARAGRRAWLRIEEYDGGDWPTKSVFELGPGGRADRLDVPRSWQHWACAEGTFYEEDFPEEARKLSADDPEWTHLPLPVRRFMCGGIDGP
jgi:hypothetical protein